MKVTTIIICSAKGGVGKSTVAANLAHALQKRRQNKTRAGISRPRAVLLIDLDLTNRALDLILGCEDSVVFDIGDFIDGKANASDILKNTGGITFAAAPAPTQKNTDLNRYAADPERLRAAVNALTYEVKASFDADVPPSVDIPSGSTENVKDTKDYGIQTAADALENDVLHDDGTLFVIIDTSGTEVPCILAPMADFALIPSGQSPASIRAAERTGILTQKSGAKSSALIINDFDMDGAKNGVRAKIIELIDRCRLKLYGVVPHDSALVRQQDKGIFADTEQKKSPSSQAFDNIAARLCGENIPVFYGIKQYRSRRKYM